MNNTFPKLPFRNIHLYSHTHTAAVIYIRACIQLYSGPIRGLNLISTLSISTARAIYI